MQLGMIGLGRMGANMVRRLMEKGHACVVYDVSADAVRQLEREGAAGAASLADFAAALELPRACWIMTPVATVDGTIGDLAPLLDRGDIVIDGGNTHYHHDLRRAAELRIGGIHYVDVGVSGGVWGRERGYCLMIGGPADPVRHLEPLFRALAPGVAAAPRTPGRDVEPGPAELGYLHCGPPGAGHFVKMVHNGIEYGLMAAYAEGLNLLHHADAGTAQRAADAETTPLAHPEHFRYELDVAAIAEVWRHGSVIGSWLLDLAAQALHRSPGLEGFAGRPSDSGEGRWTVQAAVEAGVPAHVLSAALFERFASRGAADFGNKVLSAMRFAFGGHLEKPSGG